MKVLVLMGVLTAAATVLMAAGGFPKAEALWPDRPPAFYEHEDPEGSVQRSDDPRICDRHVNHVTVPAMSIHPPIGRTRRDAAIIVCPGGGYNILAIDKEGYDVALWLNRLGYTAAVLKYRLKPYAEGAGESAPFPPLLDVRRAVRIVRSRARKLRVKPHKIGVLGFSAGGHLTLLAAARYDLGDPDANDPVERVSSRPDFLLPIYPAIPDSLPEALDENVPPMFISITADDFLLPGNLEHFLTAAIGKKLSFEYHIFPSGGHGYGMGVNGGRERLWTRLAESWLDDTLAELKPFRPEGKAPKEK